MAPHSLCSQEVGYCNLLVPFHTASLMLTRSAPPPSHPVRQRSPRADRSRTTLADIPRDLMGQSIELQGPNQLCAMAKLCTYYRAAWLYNIAASEEGRCQKTR